MINDFVTPAEKIFSRALESEVQGSIDFLQKCRPLAVSVTNALKYIKLIISQENNSDCSDDDVSILIKFPLK
jgi:translation initiation factor eIF-2B subunit delta